MPSLTVRLHRTWSDADMQTADGRPPGSHAALLQWTDPAAVDAGPPPRLAAALGAALVDGGFVAFRWSGPVPWPATDATLVRAAHPGALRAALDRLSHRWPADLVLTHHAAAAAALFTHDWDDQGQAALLLPTPDALVPALRQALATNRSWTATPLPPGTVLLTPAVDGAGVLLAAPTAATLDHLVQAIAAILHDHGIPWAGHGCGSTARA